MEKGEGRIRTENGEKEKRRKKDFFPNFLYFLFPLFLISSSFYRAE